jgi:phenylpyruvate tautomerase
LLQCSQGAPGGAPAFQAGLRWFFWITYEGQKGTVMPLLKLETTGAISEEKKSDLLKALSKLVADSLGKPERYVMVTVSSTEILMSGSAGQAAFVDLRSIGGLTREANRKLAEAICRVLNNSLGIKPDRVYLTFTDVDAAHWGWNAATFG